MNRLVKPLIHRASAVAIGGRAVLIEGPPGSGKSSLALALIDRGAVLIGDDAVALDATDGAVYAGPPPNIAGLLEVRGVGLMAFPVAARVAVALVVRLDPAAPRFLDDAPQIELAGQPLPLIRLRPDSPVLALSTEAALTRWGLPKRD